MIKKIRVIKQVGVFADFTEGNDKQFDKLTFIYGLNTFGKTTLCDIFKSLATQNNQIILNRRTKPEDSSNPQHIVLSVEESNSNRETNIIYQNNAWNNNFISEHLEIFDTAFVHENVFDGLSLLDARETKKNFTDFVLGTEGVKLAKALEEKKKKLRTLRAELKQSVPDYVKDESDAVIRDFLNLKVDKSINDIKKELEVNITKKLALEIDIKNKDDILSLMEPRKLTLVNSDNLINSIDEINKILETSFDELKEEAVEKLQEHIKNRLGNDSTAESWIKKGLYFSGDSENCPFCGQDLENVRELIDSYQSYFNEEYVSFIERIDNDLSKYLSQITITTDTENELSQILLTLKDYEGKINQDDFKNSIKAIEELKSSIKGTEKTFNRVVHEIKTSFETISNSKKQRPYIAIMGVKKDELHVTFDEYEKNIKKINYNIEKLLKAVSEYKSKFRDDTVTEELQGLNVTIKNLEKHKARLEQDDKCNGYSQKEEIINTLDKEVKDFSERLEANQNDYLDKYFETIDEYFKKLGSRNYKIKRSRASDRGYKKTYGIFVKFKDSAVSNEDLPYIFSDSDRRALALSIFWAKLQNLVNDQVKRKIVILDDPVTSFDDNRIIKNNDIIWNFKEKVDQVLLFTHYPSFVKEFYKRCNPSDRCTFMEIQQDNHTSFLKKMDIEFFCCNEMEQQFYSISDFINKRSSEDIRQKLRPYLENHLKTLFLRSMNDNSLLNQTLETKINKLHEKGIISDGIKDRLHKYRRETNPEAHIFTSNNEEDIRSFAEDMLGFLYGIDLREPLV